MKIDSKVTAFKRSYREVKSIYVVGLTCEQMLNRMIIFLEAQLQIIETHANETDSVDLDAASSEGSSKKEDGINKNSNNRNKGSFK